MMQELVGTDEEFWKRILTHAGDVFYTQDGREFTYTVVGNGLVPNQTSHLITRDELANWRSQPALSLTQLVKQVRGASFIWAILRDARMQG